MIPTKLTSVRLAGLRLGMCRQTVENLIKKGHLRAIRTPTGTVRIDVASLEEIMSGAKGQVKRGARATA